MITVGSVTRDLTCMYIINELKCILKLKILYFISAIFTDLNADTVTEIQFLQIGKMSNLIR